MYQEIRDVLTRVLAIINYSDDRNKFIEEFIKTCQAQTFTELFNRLPADKQESLKRDLTPPPAPNQIEPIFLRYFSQQDYENTFLIILQQQFQSYLQSIYSTLTQEQIRELDAYFRQLQSTLQ
jgi:hypothetical protein